MFRKISQYFKHILSNLSIAQKLVISYLFLGLATTITITFVFYKSSENALITRTLDQLTSIKLLKKKWLEQYLNTQKTDALLFTSLESSRESFVKLNEVYHTKGFQSVEYQTQKNQVQLLIKQYKLSHDFINVWYINTQEEVIFTSKDNIYQGKIVSKIEGLNPLFKEVIQRGTRYPYIADIKYISSLENVPYVILVCPITNKGNQTMGTMLVKINMKHINGILTQRTGMGNTGESYVVDANMLMRSVSRFVEEKNNSKIKVNTLAVKRAMTGNTGKDIIYDYRNVQVLSSYAAIKLDGLNWVIISEIDLEEALQPIYDLRKKIFPLIFTVCIVILFITLYLAQEITQPIQTLSRIINSLGKGILPEKELKTQNNDEIGEMIHSLNHLVDGLKKTSLFAADIGKGNFKASFEPLSEQDILGVSLLEMRNKLIELSNIVSEQNRQKTINLIEGQENERRRISRELHDGVGQMLTALKFKIQEIEDSEVTRQLKHLVDETTQEVRRVSVNLMPSVIWDFGLEAALKILFKNTNLDIDFNYYKSFDATDLNMDVRICVYRIVQESLNNIEKHANTHNVTIKADHTKTAFELSINDFGTGFDIQKYKAAREYNSSNGIRNMKERAKLVGGTFKINSEIGKGSQILVRIPI
ncbi:MAG: histidine kinase [Bacteroidota bacterium]|nr:histidine kinase [Bacteroidota bacterium]